jgi:hypothetical protein
MKLRRSDVKSAKPVAVKPVAAAKPVMEVAKVEPTVSIEQIRSALADALASVPKEPAGVTAADLANIHTSLAAISQLLKVAPAPPTRYDFEIERNRAGYLSRVVATPIIESIH